MTFSTAMPVTWRLQMSGGYEVLCPCCQKAKITVPFNANGGLCSNCFKLATCPTVSWFRTYAEIYRRRMVEHFSQLDTLVNGRSG